MILNLPLLGSKNKKDDDDGEGESAAKKPRKDDGN